jgi:5-methylcytosine-specific restriction endonuclease McrA
VYPSLGWKNVSLGNLHVTINNMSKHSSILNNKEQVEKAAQCSSIRDALHYLGLRSAGGNYKAFHNACNQFGIQIPIASEYRKTEAARKYNTIPLEKILVENSTYSNRYQIKKRCYKANLLKEICYICNCGPIWNGLSLTLQLDHINGIYNDHRIENLRILCPNCHSQTENFAGRR